MNTSSDGHNINPVRVNATQLLIDSLRIYKNHFTSYIGIALLAAIINEMAGLIVVKLNIDFVYVVLLINIVVTSWAYIATIDLSRCIFEKKKINLKKSFNAYQGIFAKYVSVLLISLFLFGSGWLFFIFPGLCIAVILIFVDIVVVLEKRTMMECFKRSVEMTKPYFWVIFVFILPITIITSIPGFILYINKEHLTHNIVSLTKILAVLITPIFIIPRMALYYKIRSLDTEDIA